MVEPKDVAADDAYQLARYLQSHTLQIDVWDADTQLLVGTAGVALHHCVRRGQVAIMTTLELQVLSLSEEFGEKGTGSSSTPDDLTQTTRGPIHNVLPLSTAGQDASVRLEAHLCKRVFSSHFYVFCGRQWIVVSARRQYWSYGRTVSGTLEEHDGGLLYHETAFNSVGFIYFFSLVLEAQSPGRRSDRGWGPCGYPSRRS